MWLAPNREAAYKGAAKRILDERAEKAEQAGAVRTQQRQWMYQLKKQRMKCERKIANVGNEDMENWKQKLEICNRKIQLLRERWEQRLASNAKVCN
jgi:hypothetical protein